jgi:hypothetical protein
MWVTKAITSIARIIDVVRIGKIQCKRFAPEERTRSAADTPDPVVVRPSAVGVMSAMPLILKPSVAGGDTLCSTATGSTRAAKFGSRLVVAETSTMFVAFPSFRTLGVAASVRAHFVKAGRMLNDTFRS